MVVAGRVGFGINVISFADAFKISVTVDDGLVSAKDCKALCKQIEDNIRNEIERAKDFPLKIKKKKND